MRAVVVLGALAPDLARQAGRAQALLDGLDVEALELWLLGHGPAAAPLVPQTRPLPTTVRLLPGGPDQAPEVWLAALEALWRQAPADLVLFPGDDLGAELATRLASRLGGLACLGVGECRVGPRGLEVTRAAYGGNLAARLLLPGRPVCLTPAPLAAPAAALVPWNGPVETRAPAPPETPWRRDVSLAPAPAGDELDRAPVVLALGRGVGGPEGVARARELAALLGAEVGGSRPVVMSAWLPMERLLGASGRVVAPKVCIAAGVSGAGVFALGVRQSDCLVAINQDPAAPIFALADFGLVADLHAVLAELTRLAAARPLAGASPGPGPV